MFNAKNSLATNNTLGQMRWNKILCSILNKSIVLLIHGLTPFVIFGGMGLL